MRSHGQQAMRTFLAVLLAAFAVSCNRSTPRPIVETATEVRIDTPQFALVIPGQWKAASESEPNTIYSAMSPGSDRQIIVSEHLLKEGLSAEERRQAVQRLLDIQVAVERQVSKGQATVHPMEMVEAGGLLVGGYTVAQPSAGRVVFSSLLCDNEKALNIHWEVLQLQTAPDLNALAQEFARITDSARLK